MKTFEKITKTKANSYDITGDMTEKSNQLFTFQKLPELM